VSVGLPSTVAGSHAKTYSNVGGAGDRSGTWMRYQSCALPASVSLTHTPMPASRPMSTGSPWPGVLQTCDATSVSPKPPGETGRFGGHGVTAQTGAVVGDGIPLAASGPLGGAERVVVPSEANGKADEGGFVVPHELSTTAIARVTIEMTTGRLIRRFMGLRRLGGSERGGCKLVAVAAVVTPEHDICVTDDSYVAFGREDPADPLQIRLAACQMII
jgi:hypothetical protein